MNDASIRNTLLVAVLCMASGIRIMDFLLAGDVLEEAYRKKRLEPSQPLNFNRMDKSDVYPAGGGSD